jgi:hypothetical protein
MSSSTNNVIVDIDTVDITESPDPIDLIDKLDGPPAVDLLQSPELQRRILEFIANPIHSQLKFGECYHKPKKISTSIVDKCGVRVSNPEHKTYYFRCLMGNCYSKQTLIKLSKTSTSRATTHHQQAHSTIAPKTETPQKNIVALQRVLDSTDATFCNDPARFFQVNISAWQSEHCITFNAFESQRWKILSKKFPIPGGEGLTKLPLRKLLIEHYVSVKHTIVGALKDAMATYRIPFISINLDLITGKTNNKKYIGMRISWNHISKMHSRNLAVREYSPSATDLATHKASQLLADWMAGILAEFGIDKDAHLLTSASDSGSDVKRALEIVVPTMREWCQSHITNLALQEAFGTGKSGTNCKNADARSAFKILHKWIESVNKSGRLKAVFDEEVTQKFGRPLKLLKNTPQHRWSSVEDSIAGVLIAWDTLVYTTNLMDMEFPLEPYNKLLTEWYSVLQRPRDIQKYSQYTKKFVIIDIYIRMAKMFVTVLNPAMPLTITDPKKRPLVLNGLEQDEEQPIETPADELDPLTTKVR